MDHWSQKVFDKSKTRIKFFVELSRQLAIPIENSVLFSFICYLYDPRALFCDVIDYRRGTQWTVEKERKGKVEF